MQNRLFDLLNEQADDFTDHDLATLADWATRKAHTVTHPNWKRPYSLLREGADLVLRRRAQSATHAEKGELNHVDHGEKSIQV
jgi:hypothetical protein